MKHVLTDASHSVSSEPIQDDHMTKYIQNYKDPTPNAASSTFRNVNYIHSESDDSADIFSDLSGSDASSTASISNILKDYHHSRDSIQKRELTRSDSSDDNIDTFSSDDSYSDDSDLQEMFNKIRQSAIIISNDFNDKQFSSSKKLEVDNPFEITNAAWSEHLEDLVSRMKKLLEQSNGNQQKLKLEQEETKLFLRGNLLDFQLTGLNWMIELHSHFNSKQVNGGFILADEMGLGKTIQIIAFLSWLKEYSTVELLPVLVICPVSTLENWNIEMTTWSKNLAVLKYHGKTEERYLLHRNYIKNELADVIITSYEIVMQDHFLFRKYTYEYVIADEAHRLRNGDTKTVTLFKRLKSKGRILVTGTPLNNNLIELFTLMNFILPSIFGDIEQLCTWFGYKSLNTRSKYEAKALIQNLHNLLRPFLLRRVKAEVNLRIPPKHEFVIYVNMEKEQKDMYLELMSKAKRFYNSQRNDQALGILMNMKKVCNHPFLVQPFVFEEGQPLEKIKESYITTSRATCGKFRYLLRMLKKFKEQNRKVIIFSLMTKMLDIIEYYLQFDSRYPYRRLDGSTPQKKRQEYINDFNQNSQVFCFLISTKAGGIGITLTAADTVIIYDSDWNPQNDIQAISRASRIGQTKLLHAYRFITVGSVENHIMNVARKKINLEKVVIQSGQFADATIDAKKKSGKVSIDILRNVLTKRNQFSSDQRPIDRKTLKWLLNFNQEQSQSFLRNGGNYKKIDIPIDRQQALGFEKLEYD